MQGMQSYISRFCLRCDSNHESAVSRNIDANDAFQMTRQIVNQQFPGNGNGNGNNSQDWHSWLVRETSLRTAFLVHVVNLLSGQMQLQSPMFFETLDERLNSALALPSLEEVWRAETAENWETCRTGLQNGTNTTAAEFMQKLANADVVGGGWRGLWKNYSEMGELARLVVICSTRSFWASRQKM